MNEEYHLLMVNDTWNLVPLLKGINLVKYKLVYGTKYLENGSVNKHKARLVSKGFSQVEGVDYTKTFSIVSKMNSIYLFLSPTTSYKWEVLQMDVKSTFLHWVLQEKIYMEQALGYIQNKSSLVCYLKKYLYGFKKAHWVSYAKIHNFLLDTKFSRCHSNPNVYIKKVSDHLIIILSMLMTVYSLVMTPNI